MAKPLERPLWPRVHRVRPALMQNLKKENPSSGQHLFLTPGAIM